MNDISSTLNNITIDIGGFIGPIIGGFLSTKYNFNICCFIMFFVAFIYLIIFLFYFSENIKNEIYSMLNERGEIIEDEINNNNEKEKLIEKKKEDV